MMQITTNDSSSLFRMNNIIFVIVLVCLLILLFILLITETKRRKRTSRITPIINNYIERENEAIENGQPMRLDQIFTDAVRDITNNIHGGEEILNDDVNNVIFITNRIPAILQPQVVQAADPNLRHAELNMGDVIALIAIEQDAVWQQTENIAQELMWQLDELEHLARSANRNNLRASNMPKPEQIKQYFDNTKKVKSDSQNVHDSSVNKHLRDTFTRLNVPYKGCSILEEKKQCEEMNTYINNNVTPQGLRVYNYIGANNPVVFSLGSNVRLYDVLFSVWKRSYHPNNKNNQTELKKSLVNALNDCFDNGSMVCTGGITARLLTSLVLLDYEKDMGHVETVEQYKNEIMSKAASILDNLVKELSACSVRSGMHSRTLQCSSERSANPELKKYAQTFATGEDDTNIGANTKKEFKDMYEDRINNMLEQYDANNIPKNIKKLIMEAII